MRAAILPPMSAPASILILALTVLVSMFALYRQPAWRERGMLRPYWLARRGEWFTLLSNALLHADLAHLLFNGFTFWAFAPGLEARIGTPRFVALYLAGIALSDLGTWLRQRTNPGYASLGASGAITAVLFASIVYFPGARLLIMPLPVPIPAPLFAVGYLAYTTWAARQARDAINHDAHLWGALAGLLFVGLTDAPALSRALHGLLG
jgi:membrane associated rhomboid family serine protease